VAAYNDGWKVSVSLFWAMMWCNGFGSKEKSRVFKEC